MTKKKKTDERPDKKEDGKWSTGAKVGAAVGSAALMAALLYAGKRHLDHKKDKPKPGIDKQPKADTD